MMTSKQCKRCGRWFDKRYTESVTQFATKLFCSRDCYCGHMRERRQFPEPKPEVVKAKTLAGHLRMVARLICRDRGDELLAAYREGTADPVLADVLDTAADSWRKAK